MGTRSLSVLLLAIQGLCSVGLFHMSTLRPIVEQEGVRAFMEGMLPSIILTQCLNQLPNILRLIAVYQGF